MKNIYLFLLIVGGLLTITVFSSNSGGRTAAGSPRTGAPSTGGGTEGTCSQCHDSGAATFGEPIIDWTIADSDGNNITEYVPGQVYNVTVAVSAPMGSPAAYGFNAVFIDDTQAPDGASAQDAGNFSNLSSFTQVVPNGGRNYIEHNDRTPSGIWTFDWTAPAAGFGEVRIYSTGNAVNSNLNTSGDSGSTSPTIITLQESATMPVTLASFTAAAEKNDVLLNWSTTMEDNADYFSVERSQAGGDFIPVGRVPTGSRSGSYAFRDADLPASNYAYRLRMVDRDGAFTYSQTLAVAVTDSRTMLAYPNPTSGPLNLVLPSEDARVRLLSASGNVLRDRLRDGAHDLSDLPPGIYLLETTGTAGREVRRVVLR